MVFAHDTEAGLAAAVALANSELDPDTLTRVADLDAFYAEYTYSGRHDRSLAELEAVRAIRGRLRDLFTSSRDDAVHLVNAMLADAGAVLQLIRHDGLDWHIHAVDPDRALAERIIVETAMAMIDVIRTDEMSRFSVCADADCDGIVLDLSRNRSKRFCSVTCGNRNAVAAYRARRRD